MQNNRIRQLKAKRLVTILVVLSCTWLHAQVNPALSDSTLVRPPASDSLAKIADDSLRAAILRSSQEFRLSPDTTRTISFSKDSLDAPVDYSARDSMIYDIAGQKIHLFGDANVKYNTISLKAGYIVFDWQTSIVTAEGIPDSLGRPSEFPQFQDGDQSFTAKQMRYNFKTRKGVVYDVTTKQNDVVVLGKKSKFVSGEPSADTTKTNDYIFSEDAIFTTCTHPNPHFGIHSKRQKVIPNKLVVVGPSNLEIMNVPTPLWLPFGFFPISRGRRSGLMFPRDYEYSDQWGFGLRDIGWFFPLGEHVNLTLTANVYLKGTWGINAASQYRKRYKYNGNLAVGYDVRRQEDNEGNISRPKSFSLRWSHNQDRSAHPINTFGGSINFQINSFQSRVFNDAANVLQNQLNSNFSFSRNWLDKPFNLNVAFSHSQNTRTSEMTVNFPTFQFQTQTLYPFRRKERKGQERWYETVTLRYTTEARSTFRGPDTTFFSSETLNKAQYGAKHDITSGTSFKLFKYFNLNPGVSYREVWYFKSFDRDYIPGLNVKVDTTEQGIITRDTISFGSWRDTTVTGFKSYRTLNASLSLTTQIFGTVRFKKGWLRGMRHVIKPSVGFNFSPNYLNPGLGYFREVPDTLNPIETDRYSIFRDGIYGAPPESGRQMAINYSFNNIFEAKIFSRKDSTEKKVKLFDNIILGGSYNFAADSLKWSQVTMGGTTRLFKGMTTLGISAIFDPYIMEADSRGFMRRVNKTAWRTNGRLVEFVNANVRFNTSISVEKIRELFQGKESEVVEDLEAERRRREEEADKTETDFLSLFDNFRINHNLTLDLRRLPSGKDTLFINTHSIDLQGNIKLTDNWNINIGRIGYDFARKSLTYPSLGFSRDLHCWEMGMNWAPTRGTYSFFIQVKPGTLGFLKIPYQRNNADGLLTF